MVNSNKLKGKITELGLSIKDLAKEVGISEHSLRNKINGITPFKADEAFILAGLLGIEEEMGPYFFVEKVAETATKEGG